MEKERSRKTKHKNPKFKDSYDEDFRWEDLQEVQNLRKKIGKRPQRKNNTQEKW